MPGSLNRPLTPAELSNRVDELTIERQQQVITCLHNWLIAHAWNDAHYEPLRQEVLVSIVRSSSATIGVQAMHTYAALRLFLTLYSAEGAIRFAKAARLVEDWLNQAEGK